LTEFTADGFEEEAMGGAGGGAGTVIVAGV